jgi:hypothetical protein
MDGDGPGKLQRKLYKSPGNGLFYLFSLLIDIVLVIVPFQSLNRNGFIITFALYNNLFLINFNDGPYFTVEKTFLRCRVR